jgi:hypothetical protein
MLAVLDSTAANAERRRYGRIRLDLPLSARFNGTRVKVLEVSLLGFLIAHEGRIEDPDPRVLALRWHDSKIELGCTIVRSALWRLSKKMGEASLYHSGLHIIESSRESFDALRELIAERILRALEEQKANARGVPPLAAYMYQPAKGDLYRQCEYMEGVWRKTETIRTDQPPNGFTVSAEVDPWHVQLLCETWEGTTAEGRRLTQLLAELSISKREGVPTRRYVP